MHPLDFPLLADENIHPDVVRFLREQHGADICSVSEEGLAGQDDTTLLRCACQENRVVLTHDSDFGTLAMLQGEPFIGIVYLRPGHIRGEFVIQITETLRSQAVEVKVPFIVVAAFNRGTLQTRVRQLGGDKKANQRPVGSPCL